MSVREGLGHAAAARKPGGVLIFVPLLIAVIGAAAIILGQMADRQSRETSGYGIDERTTGAVGPAANTTAPIIDFTTAP